MVEVWGILEARRLAAPLPARLKKDAITGHDEKWARMERDLSYAPTASSGSKIIWTPSASVVQTLGCTDHSYLYVFETIALPSHPSPLPNQVCYF